jgi:hypothetical protein
LNGAAHQRSAQAGISDLRHDDQVADPTRQPVVRGSDRPRAHARNLDDKTALRIMFDQSFDPAA